MPDVKQVGQGRQYNDYTDAYDAEKGKSVDVTQSIPLEDRTQQSSMPKAPDPSPFKLGAIKK